MMSKQLNNNGRISVNFDIGKIHINGISWYTTSDIKPTIIIYVFFDMSTWDIRKGGLLSNNQSFCDELKNQLSELVKNNVLPNNLLWQTVIFASPDKQGQNYIHLVLEQ